MAVQALLERLVGLLGGAGEARAIADELLARYAEPHRAYHDQQHLDEVLTALDLLADRAAPPAVLLAAYWHDAVYDPGRVDNEERSARLAAGALPRVGLAEPLGAEVARLVRLTAAHVPRPGDAPGALLCDADLAILAADEQRYADYAAGVRREYAHVDDASFAAGRRGVLRRLTERDWLFRTERGRVAWEAAARANVAAELSRLSGA